MGGSLRSRPTTRAVVLALRARHGSLRSRAFRACARTNVSRETFALDPHLITEVPHVVRLLSPTSTSRAGWSRGWGSTAFASCSTGWAGRRIVSSSSTWRARTGRARPARTWPPSSRQRGCARGCSPAVPHHVRRAHPRGWRQHHARRADRGDAAREGAGRGYGRPSHRVRADDGGGARALRAPRLRYRGARSGPRRRLDSTNAIDAPEAAVIARIGLDHTKLLGTTLAAIAGEKAGIVKPGSAVVSWPQDAEAMAVVEQAVAAAGDTLTCPISRA